MQHRFREPGIEIVAASFAGFRRRLRLALWTIRRTEYPDVEMIIVPAPRPHLGKPGAVRTSLAAQRFLDRRVDKDALDRRIFGGDADQLSVRMRPYVRINIAPVLPHRHGGRHEFAFLAGKLA